MKKGERQKNEKGIVMNRIYGYCRISTPNQSIDRQERNILAAYPDAEIIKEAYTGKTMSRPKWGKLEGQLIAGDTVVFDSVSRMSRDAESGFQTYQALYERGVSLVFLKEPMIDTDVYKAAVTNAVPMTGTTVDLILEGVNAYLLALAREQIRLAFGQSQKEVDDLAQRTREGMETARRNGKQIGQPTGAKLTTKKSIAAKKIIREHSRDFGGTLKDGDCMKLAEVTRNTYYRYKRELMEEMQE